MKKYINQKIVRNIIAFTLLISCYVTNAQVYINGPASIVPGEATQYTWGHFGYGYPVWSAPGGNFSPNNVAVNPYITISKSITTPTLQINVLASEASTQSVTVTDSKVVLVDPFLIGSTSVHPGSSVTITNQDNREGYSGHNACLWNWSSNPSSALFCSGGNCTNNGSNNAIFTCPTTLSSAAITNGYYTVTCNKVCGAGSFNYISNININVILDNPVISGTQDISCNQGLTNLVYTASQVNGATYYEWEVPFGWQISSGDHTNSIHVGTLGNPPGDIKVTAYAASGSPIKSGKVSLPISCCPQDIAVTNNVMSGNSDHKQADNSLTCTNAISNGADAKYHAGSFVHCSPSFYSEANSNLHVYILVCTGTYLRMSTSNEETVISSGQTVIEKIEIGESAKSANDKVKNNAISDRLNLNIYPNPNNGLFKIKLNPNLELPTSIKITDVFGKSVEAIDEPKQYEYEFNIKEQSNGIYFINVFYKDETLSGKIIKD